MPLNLRAYAQEDRDTVNAVALSAFAQYSHAYDDWGRFSKGIGNMASLSEAGEIVVAEVDGKIVGAVAYIGPHKPKSSFFDIRWPVMRMLVVHPSSRGHGIGSLLAHECMKRARRDNAEVFALHTTKLMSVALSMYERMGFVFHASAPDICGVPYGIYLKQLRSA